MGDKQTRVYYDETARIFERWAVVKYSGDMAKVERYRTEAEANRAAGIPAGSTDPDYDPRR